MTRTIRLLPTDPFADRVAGWIARIEAKGAIRLRRDGRPWITYRQRSGFCCAEARCTGGKASMLYSDPAETALLDKVVMEYVNARSPGAFTAWHLYRTPCEHVAAVLLRATRKGWGPWRSVRTRKVCVMRLPPLPGSKRHKLPRLRVKGWMYRGVDGQALPKRVRRSLDILILDPELDAEAFAEIVRDALDTIWAPVEGPKKQHLPGSPRDIGPRSNRIAQWLLVNS